MHVDPLQPTSYGQPPGPRYRDVLEARATGELPEMESSKAAARRLADLHAPGGSILDVGCGAGHYLRSIHNEIGRDFTYLGIDAATEHVEAARRAFSGEDNVSFQEGNVFSLPVEDRSFDTVLCNNLLLHLPEVSRPISELIRVARRCVLIRTLVGSHPFRVMDVHEPEGYDESGLPESFAFYNIYGTEYISDLLHSNDRVSEVNITADNDFEARGIAASASDHQGAPDTTVMMEGRQVNGYLILPWSFITVHLR